MTPDQDPQDLTPEVDTQVRRLLAAAGSSPASRLPPDIAVRLDETLAELYAELYAAESTTAPSRRRRWPQVLAAAAALAVVGTGVGTLGGLVGGGLTGSGGGSSTTSASDRAPSEAGGEAGPSLSVPSEARTFQAPAPETATNSGSGQLLLVGRPSSQLPRMQLRTAREDAQRIYQRVVLAARPGQSSSPKGAATGCSLPATQAGETLVAVRFDGQRASLLLGPPHESKRDADVYTCADPDTPVLATTVSVP